MYGCHPSTEEGGISLARFSALLVPDVDQFIFIGQPTGKAEALPTAPDSSTGNSLQHAALDASFGKVGKLLGF